MVLELYMISVAYDHNQQPKMGKLPIRKIQVENVVEQKNEDKWSISTHYRSQSNNRMMQVGIRITDSKIKSLSLRGQQDGIEVFFEKDQHENIWFEPTRFQNYKQGRYYRFEENGGVTGIANAGSVRIIGRTDDGEKELGHIQFVPSSLSIRDYERMVADLYRIREELVRGQRAESMTIKRETVPKQLKEQLKILKQAMDNINRMPVKRFHYKWKKEKEHEYRRFNMRKEIFKMLNPGKSAYYIYAPEPSVEIKEHQLIKQELKLLKKYAEFYSGRGVILEVDRAQLINEREMIFEKSNIELQQQLKTATGMENPSVYKTLKHHYEKEIERVNQLIDAEKELYKNFLVYKHEEGRPENSLPVIVSLNIKGDASNYKIEFENNRFKTTVQSNYRQEQWESAIHFLGYQYWEDKEFKSGECKSHFCSIELNTEVISQHLLLKEAVQNNRFKDVQASMKIKGYVEYPTFPLFENDPIGRRINNPRFRGYTFKFKKIQSITIEREEVVIQEEKTSLQQFLQQAPIQTSQTLSLHDELERMEISLNQLEQMYQLTKRLKGLSDETLVYDSIIQTVDDLIQLPMLQNVRLKERQPFLPTQLFLHDPQYHLVWKALTGIHRNLEASFVAEKDELQIGVVKVEQIYEIWSLYKVIHLMTETLGWQLEGNMDVVKYLDQYIRSNSSYVLHNFIVSLTFQNWKVEITYEPKIYLANVKNYRTPDLAMRFIKNEEVLGIAYLDAKYRNYKTQGNEQWIKDIQSVAIDKYGAMEPADNRWRYNVLASFILHPDVEFGQSTEQFGKNYSVTYSAEDFVGTEEAHKYGSIYMTPSVSYMFKNWLRMIMEYQLGQYHICWNCGCADDVKRVKRFTFRGKEKYHFTCQQCKEFWVKVHCRNWHSHLLVKHVNNYHHQLKRNYKWYVICPVCGDGDEDRENPGF